MNDCVAEAWNAVRALEVDSAGQFVSAKKGRKVDLSSPELQQKMLIEFEALTKWRLNRFDPLVTKHKIVEWIETYGFPINEPNIQHVQQLADCIGWLVGFERALKDRRVDKLKKWLQIIDAVQYQKITRDDFFSEEKKVYVSPNISATDVWETVNWMRSRPQGEDREMQSELYYEQFYGRTRRECIRLTFAPEPFAEWTGLFAAKPFPFLAVAFMIKAPVAKSGLIVEVSDRRWRVNRHDELLIAANRYMEQCIVSVMHGIQFVVRYEQEESKGRFKLSCPYHALVWAFYKHFVGRPKFCANCDIPFFAKRSDARFCPRVACRQSSRRKAMLQKLEEG